MSASITARFVEGARGRLFTVMYRPDRAAGAGVLVVPAFAEEMNRSRRMLAQVGLALRQCGIATIMADPYGTGDSEGELRDATLADWVEDLARVASWSANEGWPISGLLCVRFGCLLGAQLARSALRGAVRKTVFWQPVIDGSRFFTQFLRLRVAASMMSGNRESVSELRQKLLDGQSIAVAGYEVSPALAEGFEELALPGLLTGDLGTLRWIELRSAAGEIPTASEQCLQVARSAGVDARASTLPGEPFWSATEIVQLPEWVRMTTDTFADLSEPHR